HAGAVVDRDPAHVRVARGEPAAVRELDVIAVTAVAAGELDRAVGDRVDRRAVPRAEVETGVHPPIAEDRVAAPAVARGDAAGAPREQAGARLVDARRRVEAAVGAPAHQLLARLSVTQETGVEQLPGLDFAGRGALVFDDQIEFVAGRDGAIEIDFGAQRAQVLLHRAGGRAGGARRAIAALPDHAPDAQRSVVDLDRPRVQGEPAAAPFDRELEVEARAERQRLERPRGAGRRAPAQRDVDRRSGS